MERPELFRVRLREPAAEPLAHVVDRIRIDDRQLLGDHLLRRQRDREGAQGAVERLVAEHPRPGLRIARHRGTPLEIGGRLRRGDEQRERELLAGVPAVEGVVVVGHQEGELIGAPLHLEPHRRREAAQHRRHRPFADPLEDEGRLRVAELEHTRRRGGLLVRGGIPREPERQRVTVRAEEPDGDGVRRSVARALADHGLTEVLTYPFVGPERSRRACSRRTARGATPSGC